MKNYPIKNEHLHASYDHIYSESEIQVFPWGKKMYLIHKDSLRAIIPLYTAMATDDRKPAQTRGWDTYLGCRIAGQDGIKLINMSGCYDRKFFLTPEDYDRFCKDGKGRYTPSSVRLSEVLRPYCCGISNTNCCTWYAPQLWYFDHFSQRPKLRTVVIEALWIDNEGNHVELRMINGDTKYFRSEKECMDANKKQVVEFPDDAETEPEPVTITLTREQHLTAESIQEVTLQAWPIIYGKDNQYDLDSRNVLEEFRHWGAEFEGWWMSHDEDWRDYHDYLEEITKFTDKKVGEYLRSIS